MTNGKSQTDYERLQLISNSLIETIKSSKEKLYCKLFTKLANPIRHQKLIGQYSKLVNDKKNSIIS